MAIVTIAATYGAGGSVVAPAVAERLSLPFVERAIPPALARELDAPLTAALAEDADHTGAVARGLAAAPGAVIVGRAAVFVLRGCPDTLHVRLDGPVEARRRAAMAHRKLDYESAARAQRQTDRARRAYVEHFHPQAGVWNDFRNYHLVLDSTVISLDACVDVIVRAARDLFE